MSITQLLQQHTAAAVQQLYGAMVEPKAVVINEPPEQFTGDFSLPMFAFSKIARKAPPVIAVEVAAYLKNAMPSISHCEIVQGFINVSFSDAFWLETLQTISQTPNYGRQPAKNEVAVVEYCSPNTNKALHLGHLRNMFLGHAIAEILAFNGYEVKKVTIYNDRGIAICKSMLAWLKFGNGETPATNGIKGDHLIDKYYVLFGNELKRQIAEYKTQHPEVSNDEAEKQVAIMQEANALLERWEAGDPDTVAVWKQLNSWVYDGFNATFEQLGIHFDRNYYESNTYLLGKDIVQKGLDLGVFQREADSSVQIDLTDIGLDKKVLLRRNGTSVYITQDLGTAALRYEDYQMNKMIYVVGNEQDYHFKVLFACLERLRHPYAKQLYHLSYGMVDLPTGKMKSREGTTVFADDLITQMQQEAAQQTAERGKVQSFSEQELIELYHILGIGALKFFILRVNPQKNMIFNPKESIELTGFTAPFIQYTYARIQSLLQKDSRQESGINSYPIQIPLSKEERKLVVLLYKYPTIIAEAATQYDPSILTTYCYDLARAYNKFYAECPILRSDVPTEQRHFRLVLSRTTANTICSGLHLLGIDVPMQM